MSDKCQVCGHPKKTEEHAGISHLPFSVAHRFMPMLPSGNNSGDSPKFQANVTVREHPAPVWERIHQCVLELDTYCFAERLMPGGERAMHIKCILQKYFDVTHLTGCDVCGKTIYLPNELCDECKGV